MDANEIYTQMATNDSDTLKRIRDLLAIRSDITNDTTLIATVIGIIDANTVKNGILGEQYFNSTK